jgi:probable rRNA maturation factor
MDFFIENLHPALQINPEALERKILNMVHAEGFSIEYLGIILSTHQHIHEMNIEFLGHDYQTDVISFPLNGTTGQAAKVVDGEVYVDLDMAAERAPEFDSDFETETFRYVLHGTLHLLGYDDATPELKAQMRSLEDQYLQAA